MFAFDQLPPNAVNQEMLIDGVEVEEEDQPDEPSNGLREKVQRVQVLMNGSVWKQKRSQPDGKQESDDKRADPQPPFPALDPPEGRAQGFGLCVSELGPTDGFRRWQYSPFGGPFFACRGHLLVRYRGIASRVNSPEKRLC